MILNRSPVLLALLIADKNVNQTAIRNLHSVVFCKNCGRIDPNSSILISVMEGSIRLVSRPRACRTKSMHYHVLVVKSIALNFFVDIFYWVRRLPESLEGL